LAIQISEYRLPRVRRPRPRPHVARWRAPVALLAVVLGLVVGQGVAIAVILAVGDGGAGGAIEGLGLVLADLVMLGIIVAFARKGTEKLAPATFGVRRTRFWRAVGWTLLIIVAVRGAYALYTTFVASPEAAGGTGGDPVGGGVLVGVLLVLGVAVTAPIVEELAFRGYLFPALTRWKGPWVAAVLSSVLFGAAHFAVYPPEIWPVLTLFGFGACLLVWITRSLLPAIALHALNNGLAVSVGFDWSWQIPAVTLAAVAVSLVVMAPFARTHARNFVNVRRDPAPAPTPST